MINIKNFESNLLKIDKKSYRKIDMYYIRYITIKKRGLKNIHSVNALYFIINKADGYNQESSGPKYLAFASTDGNKEVLPKFTKLWDKIKYLIKTINGGEVGEHRKDFIRIRFESDDNLPLGKYQNFIC